MRSSLHRLYQTKLQLLATVLVFAGFVLMVVGHWARRTLTDTWLQDVPITDLGSTLLIAGLLTVALDYIDRDVATARDTERLREVFDEKTPALRDAVYSGLAVNADALRGIASPETLDRVIRNSLAVRLGDNALAADIYADLHRQVVRASERCRDARATVTLSPWPDGPVSGRGAMYMATVRWEYRVTPTNQRRRFTCVSDLTEYRRLADQGKDAIWYFEPIAGLNAASDQAFELVQFTVDGTALPIRRSKRADSQSFTVELRPTDLGRQVKLAFIYRLLVQKHAHVLYLDILQPTRVLTVELSYAGTGIRHVTALDFIASATQPHTVRSPKSVPGTSVSIGFDGWVFPKSGVAFVWVLDEEVKGGQRSRAT